MANRKTATVLDSTPAEFTAPEGFCLVRTNLSVNLGTAESPMVEPFDFGAVPRKEEFIENAARNAARDRETPSYDAAKLPKDASPETKRAVWLAAGRKILRKWETEGYTLGGGVKLSPYVVEGRIIVSASKVWKDDTTKCKGLTKKEALKLGEADLRTFLGPKHDAAIQKTLAERAANLAELDDFTADEVMEAFRGGPLPDGEEADTE